MHVIRLLFCVLMFGLAVAADGDFERHERLRSLVSVVVFVALSLAPVGIAWWREVAQFPAIVFLSVWTFLGLCLLRFAPDLNLPMAPHFACMGAWILALWRSRL